MKKRLGHVTNSSSSSFIIGKAGDNTITVEFAYSLIRDLYLDMINSKQKLIDHISNNPKYPVTYDGKDFHIKSNDLKNYIEIREMVERDFGISLCYSFNFDYEWTACETYKDYEMYWMNKFNNSEKGTRLYAPFTIIDLENENEVFWPHISSVKNIHREIHDVSKDSELFEWYEEEEDFDLVYDEYNVCKRLGRVCIYSECGYIHQDVVEKLCDISELSCNHMG